MYSLRKERQRVLPIVFGCIYFFVINIININVQGSKFLLSHVDHGAFLDAFKLDVHVQLIQVDI